MSLKKDVRPVTYLKTRAAGLLKLISQGEDDLRKGRKRTHDEVFSRIAKAVDEK